MPVYVVRRIHGVIERSHGRRGEPLHVEDLEVVERVYLRKHGSWVGQPISTLMSMSCSTVQGLTRSKTDTDLSLYMRTALRSLRVRVAVMRPII